MKKRKKRTPKRKVMHEIIGVLVFAIGLFSGLSLYFTDKSGVVGLKFENLQKGLFGIAAYILPILLMTGGILIIIAYHKNINRTKLILSFTTVVLILSVMHLLFFNKLDLSGPFVYMQSSYVKGTEGIGTGILTAPFTYIAYLLFGLAGSYVVLLSLMLVNILLLTNLSLKQIGNDFYQVVQSKRTQILEKKRSQRIVNSPVLKHNKPFIGEVIPIDQEGSDEELEKSSSPMDSIKIIDFQKDKDEQLKTGIANENNPPEDNTFYDISDEMNKKVKQETLPYMIPPLTLLKEPVQKKGSGLHEKKVLSNAKLLEETLNSFGVSAKVVQVSRGPVITRYELQPAPGVKVSRIVSLADDIALNLAAQGVRIEAPIPGKAAIGIEVPNKDIAPVLLREVLESEKFTAHTSKVAFALGKDIAGNNIIADISKMPHLLIAGATGSGKSVCINTLIISILYKANPDEVKLIMIDPKVVELNNYNGIPHLLIPVVTDPKKAAGALNWAVQEMVSRYKMFADKGVRDLERYNEQISDEEDETPMPQIVLIIDELADLMMVAPGDVEDAICRLAQMARAAGIHLVIATQRPSVDVITGVIKANIPSRIAFAVSSHTDSRTILDSGGAEKLLGRGDMLFYPVGASKPVRVQGAFITEKEVENVVKCIKNQNNAPQYNMEVLEEIVAEGGPRGASEGYDELLPDAIEVVIDAGQASISMIQRRLRVGYARAARLIDEMEKRGLVSGFNGSKTRNVMITKEEFDQQFGD